MLKDLQETTTIRIGGKTRRAHIKYKETKDSAKECATKCKKKGFHYRIEPVTDAMRKNLWAGVPYGAKYFVTYWRQ